MFCLWEYLFIVRKWKIRPACQVHKQSWERKETRQVAIYLIKPPPKKRGTLLLNSFLFTFSRTPHPPYPAPPALVRLSLCCINMQAHARCGTHSHFFLFFSHLITSTCHSWFPLFLIKSRRPAWCKLPKNTPMMTSIITSFTSSRNPPAA